MIGLVREDARRYAALWFPGSVPTARAKLAAAIRSRGLLLLAGHRAMQAMSAAARRPGASLPLRAALRGVMFLLGAGVQVLTRSDLRLDADIAPGVYLSDRGHLVIGARSVGEGSIIHDRVTIGWNQLARGTPRIGRNVWIGPGSVIVGDLDIGDGVTVLPGTVLTRSVPAGFVVGGNPARWVRRSFDNAPLRATLDPAPTLPGA